MPKKKAEEANLTQLRDLPPEKVIIPALQVFLTELECIREMFAVVVPVLQNQDIVRKRKIESLLRKSSAKGEKKEKIKLTISDAKTILGDLQKLEKATTLFKQNAIVMLVSRFDEYLAKTLSAIYLKDPEKLRSKDKTLSYSEILELDSTQSLLENIITKEIDKFLRESHKQQLSTIDKTHKLGLLENCACWKNFIEITERRNLFVHSGGKVSKQYLQVCGTEEIKIMPSVKNGTQLEVTSEYFEDAINCFYEISIRLTQAILRRLFPDNLSATEADRALNDIGFKLLQDENWKLANIVFDFALNIPKKLRSSDEHYKMFLINKCIALYWLNQKDAVKQSLDKEDWSSADMKFKIAKAVLHDDFSKAEKMLAMYKKDNPFTEEGFRTWPIFKKFRETNEFKRAFKKIYHKEYIPVFSKEEQALAEKVTTNV